MVNEMWTVPNPYVPASPIGSMVAFPDDNSSTFTFTESTPGMYAVALLINDSTGNGYFDSFGAFDWPPAGIWVNVLASPTPSPSASPSPPNISFLSEENKTYTTNNIPLNFTLSKPAQWIGYSLDGQANITTDGNITLTGLSNGQHNVIIYANDTYGNNAPPQTITFTINKPSTFPITEADTAAAIVSVIL